MESASGHLSLRASPALVAAATPGRLAAMSHWNCHGHCKDSQSGLIYGTVTFKRLQAEKPRLAEHGGLDKHNGCPCPGAAGHHPSQGCQAVCALLPQARPCSPGTGGHLSIASAAGAPGLQDALTWVQPQQNSFKILLGNKPWLSWIFVAVWKHFVKTPALSLL